MGQQDPRKSPSSVSNRRVSRGSRICWQNLWDRRNGSGPRNRASLRTGAKLQTHITGKSETRARKIGGLVRLSCRYGMTVNEITIPDSVKRIGNAAFGDCDRITKASIPETLEDFKNEIFDGCKALSFKRGLTVRQLAGSSGYEERVKTYRLEAARGNADAQYELGVCYIKGKGVGKDIAEAAKWWQKAANQGHADAQFQLGCLYYQGEGVKVNLPEAVNLWRKAAAQGQADALYNLGGFYYVGFPAGNVPRDRIEGLRLLRMAVEKGNKNAKEFLFRIKGEARSRDF